MKLSILSSAYRQPLRRLQSGRRHVRLLAGAGLILILAALATPARRWAQRTFTGLARGEDGRLESARSSSSQEGFREVGLDRGRLLRRRSAEAAAPAVGTGLSAAAWPQRRDQMILPAARVKSSEGTMGSGFVVANNESGTYVLTNHHVVRKSIQQVDRWDPLKKSSSKVENCQPVKVELFRYDERGGHTQTITSLAEIVAYTPYGDEWEFEGDLALLKLRSPAPEASAARVITEEGFLDEVRILDEIIMVGCPDGSEIPLPTRGHLASLTEERAGVGLLLSQVFGNPGSSGSAVYRFSPERNVYEVIAVHSMVDSRGSLTDVGRGSFLRLGVPVAVVHEFFRTHGFEELLVSPEERARREAEEEAAAAKAAEEAEAAAKAEREAENSTETDAPAANATVAAAEEDSKDSEANESEDNATSKA
eukprot:TRINITY_DN5384_c0_g1_i1.p1 TRINITY_DN5384_c0_g1~~TRINITY_DN5384_c0_g1_i1.p1  ORF type:complete len:423 (-),score=103.35 TRINITY_DN5384_c0_g1_i1:310-1578(-)